MSRVYRSYCQECRYCRLNSREDRAKSGHVGFCTSPLASGGSTPLVKKHVKRGCSDFKPRHVVR